MTTTLYESAAQTAAKVRKTLKSAFPGASFSVQTRSVSVSSSVTVSWTDGPVKSDIENVLKRFESGRYDSMRDMYQIEEGYVYEGSRYIGADMLIACRTITTHRRDAIRSYMEDHVPVSSFGHHTPLDWERAEREMLTAGILPTVTNA